MSISDFKTWSKPSGVAPAVLWCLLFCYLTPHFHRQVLRRINSYVTCCFAKISVLVSLACSLSRRRRGQANEYPAVLFRQFTCLWEASLKSCLFCVLTTIELWSSYFFSYSANDFDWSVTICQHSEQDEPTLWVSRSSGM